MFLVREAKFRNPLISFALPVEAHSWQSRTAQYSSTKHGLQPRRTSAFAVVQGLLLT
jgi:hypothetical protein